jgi:hypothetical protein
MVKWWIPFLSENLQQWILRLVQPPLCLSLTTPWSRVLLEKLTVTHLLKKFPTLYGTRRFVTVFTKARPRPCVSFLNVFLFYGEVSLVSHNPVSPSPKLEVHFLSFFFSLFLFKNKNSQTSKRFVWTGGGGECHCMYTETRVSTVHSLERKLRRYENVKIQYALMEL